MPQEQKMDLLNVLSEKAIMKLLQNNQIVYLSSPVVKFNDYRKKQERGLLVTSQAVYNLSKQGIIFQQVNIKRKIELQRIVAISVSRIGTEFVLHVPSEYDYRYSAIQNRQQILYFIIKAYYEKTGCKMGVYCRDQVSLVNYAMTKEEKKRTGIKQIIGCKKTYDHHQFSERIKNTMKQLQQMRESTKTLFTNGLTQHLTIDSFVPSVLLGRGAFGSVYLAQQRKSKKYYAMKCLQKQHIINKDQIQHTKTQKMILEHVNHPFLVNLCYAFQTQEKLYFIMEFMKGGQLFQHLFNQRKFPEKQAKFYAAQVALGIGHLHSKDFIYRDLKLENILMDQNGYVCLSDFGMSKMIKQGQLTKTFCGTPQYIAPEVLNGEGYDKMADWWALGILIYEMLFGIPPFYSKSLNQGAIFKMIKQCEIRFPDKVSVSIQAKELIAKLLNKKPASRLGSKRGLEQILDHQWFKGIDIKKLLKKEVQPPFKPKVEGDSWMQGFEKQLSETRFGSSTDSPQSPVQKPSQSPLIKEMLADF